MMIATFLATFLMSLFPCLFMIGLVWFIFPKFIPLKHKIFTRTKVAIYNSMGLITYIITLALTIQLGSSQLIGEIVVASMLLSLIISMVLTTWLTARYKDFVFTQKLSTTPLSNPNQPSIISVQENNNAPSTPSDTPPPLATTQATLDNVTTNSHSGSEFTPTSQNEQDWQAYKNRMEERWQNTKQSFNKKSP